MYLVELQSEELHVSHGRGVLCRQVSPPRVGVGAVVKLVVGVGSVDIMAMRRDECHFILVRVRLTAKEGKHEHI